VTPEKENLYLVLLAAGFDQADRARSAFMFASLAASAGMRAVVFCVQEAVELLRRGAIEEGARQAGGGPGLAQRIAEALEAGVEIHACTQALSNRGISPDELMAGVSPHGAMSFIDLSTRARALVSF